MCIKGFCLVFVRGVILSLVVALISPLAPFLSCVLVFSKLEEDLEEHQDGEWRGNYRHWRYEHLMVYFSFTYTLELNEDLGEC